MQNLEPDLSGTRFCPWLEHLFITSQKVCISIVHKKFYCLSSALHSTGQNIKSLWWVYFWRHKFLSHLNMVQKSGVDLWGWFLECMSWVLLQVRRAPESKVLGIVLAVHLTGQLPFLLPYQWCQGAEGSSTACAGSERLRTIGGGQSTGNKLTERRSSQNYYQQESLAIAKTTAWCAQYMGALKSFESPRKCPRLLFPKFVKGFCPDRY